MESRTAARARPCRLHMVCEQQQVGSAQLAGAAAYGCRESSACTAMSPKSCVHVALEAFHAGGGRVAARQLRNGVGSSSSAARQRRWQAAH